MTSQILVGIDRTPAHEAVSLATALAVLTGSELVLGAVYGYDSGNFGGLSWPPREDADGWLKEAESRLDGQGLPWRSLKVGAESVAEGLVSLAERESASMIVLGSSHRGAMGRVLAGSTVRRVIHGAPCAVAVAPHRWQPLPPNASVAIGAALAAAPEACDALVLAARLSAAAHARLQVITVVQEPVAAHPMFAATGTSYERWVAEARSMAQHRAHEVLAVVAPDADAGVVVLDGDPLERLTHASERLDLLVLGSRRYGPVRTTLLGGVSSPLIERAACPLIIVPRGIHAPAASLNGARVAVQA